MQGIEAGKRLSGETKQPSGRASVLKRVRAECRLCLAVLLLWTMAGCGETTLPQTVESGPVAPEPERKQTEQPTKQAFFGDLHVHTRYSFDAYIFGTRATPDDAYRFAKGDMLEHASGMQMKLRAPLDFLAVSDHATYLGMFEQMDIPSSSVGEHPLSVALRAAASPEERNAVFREILPRERGFVDSDDLLDLEVVRGAWQEIITAAERHNAPGRFTTFIGYEFTAGGRRGENLHRNVIFRGGEVPEMPYSRLDAKNNPERLWDWMDSIRGDGMQALAIPHNSNGSDGWMFELKDRSGNALTPAYAQQRLRNEPIVEITQVKGTSDAHPLLSPNDEWADFGIMEQTIGSGLPSKPQGSYVREAYLNGLLLGEANPFRFGLIGSSDTHNAAGSFQEDNYWSKTGLLDITPEQRGTVPNPQTGEYDEVVRQFWGASGLAGVWARANTREALFDAMQAKETFATTGPRMRVRMFAGTDLSQEMLADETGIAQAYAAGVPMGGDLMLEDDARPRLLVWATRDPLDASLDRLQIIKGWVAEGVAQEKVFDVACGVGTPDAATHRCAPNEAMVDLKTCAVDSGLGAAELTALWEDPEYTAGQTAFYYVRVLQNPTCRWSTWDALRAGLAPKASLPATIQERAWSSPVWVSGG